MFEIFTTIFITGPYAIFLSSSYILVFLTMSLAGLYSYRQYRKSQRMFQDLKKQFSHEQQQNENAQNLDSSEIG